MQYETTASTVLLRTNCEEPSLGSMFLERLRFLAKPAKDNVERPRMPTYLGNRQKGCL